MLSSYMLCFAQSALGLFKKDLAKAAASVKLKVFCPEKLEYLVDFSKSYAFVCQSRKYPFNSEFLLYRVFMCQSNTTTTGLLAFLALTKAWHDKSKLKQTCRQAMNAFLKVF